MILALLASAALAGDAPERPAPPPAIDGECSATMGITIGKPLPTSLVGDGNSVSCSAIVVPLSDYQDLLQTEAWAESIAALYVIDVAHIEFERDWFRAELVKSEEPMPFWSRPGTMIGVGGLAGVASVLVSAYALHVVE